MKCNEAEKLLLLQDADELTDNQASELLGHIESCKNCRAFEESLVESRLAFHAMEEPPAKAVQNVLREARVNAPAGKPLRIFGLRPAVAIAASVLIGLGLFISAFAPGKVGMEMVVSETQLLEPDDQIVSVMYSGLSDDNLAFNFVMTYDEG